MTPQLINKGQSTPRPPSVLLHRRTGHQQLGLLSYFKQLPGRPKHNRGRNGPPNLQKHPRQRLMFQTAQTCWRGCGGSGTPGKACLKMPSPPLAPLSSTNCCMIWGCVGGRRAREQFAAGKSEVGTLLSFTNHWS